MLLCKFSFSIVVEINLGTNDYITKYIKQR